MSVIIRYSQQAMVGFIFLDLCSKKGEFELSVAYKSIAHKKKRVMAWYELIENQYSNDSRPRSEKEYGTREV